MDTLERIIARNNVPPTNKPLVFWNTNTVEREYNSIPVLSGYSNSRWTPYPSGNISLYHEYGYILKHIAKLINNVPANVSVGWSISGHTLQAWRFDNGYKKCQYTCKEGEIQPCQSYHFAIATTTGHDRSNDLTTEMVQGYYSAILAGKKK